MGRVYTVRNQTAGAAAIKTFISWAAAANAVVKLRGMQIGNTAATAAQGTEWELLRKSVTLLVLPRPQVRWTRMLSRLASLRFQPSRLKELTAPLLLNMASISWAPMSCGSPREPSLWL
mgnify:CR=1 FL=1